MVSFTNTHFRRAVYLLFAFVLGYLLLLVFVALVQRKLIFVPTRFSADAAEQVARNEGLMPWRNSAGEVIGWRQPAQTDATASVLVLHGNAGSAVHRGYIAGPIHAAAPVDVFVLEYPGYGARPGSPSMRSFVAAAEEALAMLPTNRPLYLVAESIGTGVAAHLARTHGTAVSGLLCFAPYDDLASVGQSQMPILPVKWLLRDRFRPAEWLKDYRGPIKIVLAERDTIIPTRFGQRLHDRLLGPKSLEIIPGVGHNDIAAQSADWWKSVLGFWRENPPKK